MMVVFHHAIGQMENRGGRDISFDVTIGNAGVDLFFVISGFIMVHVTHGRDQTCLGFWIDRLRRIVPLYWFYTLLMASIALFLPFILKTAEFDAIHILKSLFFIPSYHPNPAYNDHVWPLLVQGWSLNYEMFFYFVFGSLMVFGSIWIRTGGLTLILVVLVVLGQIFGSADPAWRTYTSPLLLEFLAGAGIGVAYLRGNMITRKGAWLCITIGLGLFVLAIWRPGWAEGRAIVWGLPSVFLVVGALGLETGRGSFRTLNLLGDASYSTYLSHTFTLGVIGVLWGRFGNGSALFDGLMFLFALVASAAIGILSYQLIEQPMDQWLRRRL